MPKPIIPPGQRPGGPPGQQPEPPTGDVSVELSMAKATAYIGELGASTGGGGATSPTLVSSFANYVDTSPTPTYYVDAVSGNNGNAGTSTGAAWQTLAKLDAMSGSFAAGHVIALKRGQTFAGTLYIYNVHGAAGNRITYTAYGAGADPIIDATGEQHGIDANTSSHFVISNLRVKSATLDGVHIAENASDLRIYKVYSELNGRDGFASDATLGVTDQDDIEVSRCEAYRNGRAGFMAVRVGYGANGVHYYNCKSTYNGQATGHHGFSAWYANGIHWHGCEAAFTNIDPGTGLPNAFTGEGIGFAYDDASGNGSTTYCYPHDNAGPGIAAGHFANLNEVSYNLVADNLGDGIVVNGDPDGSDNIKVYNNTIVGNANGIAVIQPSAGLLVKNNIIATNSGWGVAFSASGVSAYSVATNVLFSNGSGATQNVSGATGTISADPTLDAAYVPVVGSPAINAGLTLTNNMGLHSSSSWPLLPAVIAQSGTWEIGAFVYG